MHSKTIHFNQHFNSEKSKEEVVGPICEKKTTERFNYIRDWSLLTPGTGTEGNIIFS